MNSDYQGKPSDKSSALAYHMFVSGLAKDPNIVLSEMTQERMDLVHAVLGVAGEVGELVDAVKKVIINNKELDRTNVVEELGDINFYLQMIQQRLFISDNEIINHNMKKLGVRYAAGYSDKAAAERADKVEDNLTIQQHMDNEPVGRR